MFGMAAAVAATQAFVVDIVPDSEEVDQFTESQGKAVKNSLTRNGTRKISSDLLGRI